MINNFDELAKVFSKALDTKHHLDEISIFVMSILIYTATNIYNSIQYGWHSTLGIESWWYYRLGTVSWQDVQIMIVDHKLDIHIPLFRFLYAFLPHDIQVVFYTNVVFSAFLSVLVYLLAKKLYGRNVGLLSGIIFTLFPSQFFWRTAGYTRDVLVMPIYMLIFYLFYVYLDKIGDSSFYKKEAIIKGGPVLAAIAFLFFVEYTMNVTVFLLVPILAVAYLEKKVEYLRTAYAKIALVVALIAVVIYARQEQNWLVDFFVFKGSAAFWILSTPADVLPIKLEEFLTRFQYFPLFVIGAIIICQLGKQKDHMAMFCFFAGYLGLSFIMTRGVRYLDISVVIYSMVFLDWLFSLTERYVAWRKISVPSLLRGGACVLMLLFTFSVVTQFYNTTLSATSGLTEADYEVLNRSKSLQDGSIFINWPYFWTAQAISGHPVELGDTETWWMNQDAAWRTLAAEGVRYVYVAFPRDFALVPNDVSLVREKPAPPNLEIDGKKVVTLRRYASEGDLYIYQDMLDADGNVLRTESYYNINIKLPPPKAGLTEDFIKTENIRSRFIYLMLSEELDPTKFKLVLYREDEFGNFARLYQVIYPPRCC